MMKKSLVLFFLCCSLNGFSQNADKVHDVFAASRKLIALYNSTKSSQLKACYKGCVFIRFKIDSVGNFCNFSYTKGAPAFLGHGLQQAFTELKDLNLLLAKNWRNQTYLLPLIVYYEAGCSVKPDQFSEPNHFGDNIEDILAFEDGEQDTLTCTVLPPITVSTQL